MRIFMISLLALGIIVPTALSPLARRRSPEVNQLASACQAEPDQAGIPNPQSTTDSQGAEARAICRAGL